MNLVECQDWIAARCHSDYYANQYRAMENDYLPHLCGLIETLPAKPVTSMEVGPGWGTMAAWLAFRKTYCVLVDLVPLGNYITQALLDAIETKSLTQVRYIQADVCRGIPGAVKHDLVYDLVLMTQVLPHLKWNPLPAVQNLADATRHNGLCIVTALDRHAYPRVLPPYEHWHQVPERGTEPPNQEMVVTMYDSGDLMDLMGTAFGSVRVYRPKGSTCLFAECREPRHG